MAWQTPKTNWGAADGVRDSDFNRIEGNILELYNTAGIRANNTVYVSATGNDSSGKGTSASPYATINKALSMLPKLTNGYEAIVSISAGTYNEAVKVAGFAGRVTLTGAGGATINVTSLTVDACVCLINNINFKASSSGSPITVTNSGALLCTSGSLSAHTTATGVSCVSVTNMSSLLVNNTLTCTGVGGGAGLICNTGSKAHVNTLAGSNKANGMEAGNGGTISYVTTTISATGAVSMTFTGGRIYSAAQTSIPNY